MKRVTFPGMNFTFECQPHNSGPIQQFQWLLNGTRLEDLNQTERIMTHTTTIFGLLNFNIISVEYNDTTIQCIVTLTSGEVISSNNATLLVQGEEKIT